MSSYHGIRKTESVGALTISGANAVEYIPGQPVDVKRLISVVTTGVTVAPAVMTVSKRPTAGSASGAVTVGTYSIPVAAAGLAQYVEFGRPATAAVVAVDNTDTYSGLPDILKLDVGESLNLASDGGATAGVVQVYVEVYEQPFVGSRISDATRLTFTYS